MSLIQLLFVGQSVVRERNHAGRYRKVDPLPKFGPVDVARSPSCEFAAAERHSAIPAPSPEMEVAASSKIWKVQALETCNRLSTKIMHKRQEAAEPKYQLDAVRPVR